MFYSGIFLIIALCWILQLYLNSLHVHKFHKQFNSLRAKGDMSAIGMAGKYWQGRAFGILVCDKEGTIIIAKYLSGLTVFSSLKEETMLVGRHVRDINEDTNPDTTRIKKKVWKSFIHAASFVIKKLDQLEENNIIVHSIENSDNTKEVVV